MFGYPQETTFSSRSQFFRLFGGFRNLGMKILIESRRVDLDPVPAFRSSFTNNQVRNDAGPVALSRSSYVLESSASHQIILY